ncbi:hypothetical protein N7507_004726 [Penicillium longicatenatum]|nr:hypothetical protein N7507_004726 [Penicillium longicatenatum]
MDDNIIKSKGLTISDNIIKSDRPRALKARKKKTTAQKTQKPQNPVVSTPGCGVGHQPPPLPSYDERCGLEANKENKNEHLTPSRIFNPTLYPDYFKPQDITVVWGHWRFLACPTAQVKCSDCGKFPFHLGCLVVSIDGGCLAKLPDEIQPRCAVTVFFGHGNGHNVVTKIKEKPNTAQVALLKACVSALIEVINVCDVDKPKHGDEYTFPLHTLVIQTDSSYIYQGVTEWMPKWKASGWKNSRGRPIANEGLWRLVDLWVRHLEATVAVQFWLVPRELNSWAREMSKWALEN